MAEQKAEAKEPKAEQPKKEETIIFKDKQARIIMSLRTPGQDWYISSLAKATDTTYVHTCRFIGMCEAIGITSSEKHGKIKVIRLTERGTQLADMVASIYAIIGQPKSPRNLMSD